MFPFSVAAQNGDRAASFMPDPGPPAIAPPDFSGLAGPPAETPAPPVKPSAPSSDAAISDVETPHTETPAAPPPVIDVTDAGLWKGTSYSMARQLVAMAALTSSATLNDLARHVLLASPLPESDAAADNGGRAATPDLDALRIDRLVSFADAASAWQLATRAGHPAIEDTMFRRAAETALAANSEAVCPAVPAAETAHPKADWRKVEAICQLSAKDNAAATATLNSLRTGSDRDDIFLEIADRNILGDGKTLPGQMTPLTPALLALAKTAGLPLPGDLYSHPDPSLVPALLTAPSRQEAARLGLAERMAARGAIEPEALAAVYAGIDFTPEARAAALSSMEPGARLRALLYQAANSEKDAAKRTAYAVKFMQSAAPVLQDGAGQLAAGMIGPPADPSAAASNTQPDNAVTMTLIYAQAGKGEAALGWLRQARANPADAAELQNLWPQLALAGLESDKDFAADLGRWLDAALPAPDSPLDLHAARDNTAAALLLLDAAGLAVPDSIWPRLLALPHTDRHVAFSPVLLSRMQSAGHAGRRAETILLGVALAQGNDIPLPLAVAITRALRGAGYKSEAATFARQQLALLIGKTN